MAQTLLQVHSLAARRGGRLLFRDLNMRLDAGDILHLHGVNGSGKTTLLELLAGLGTAAAGKIHWRAQLFRHIGHNNALKPMFSARENLLLPASGETIRRADVDAALQRVGLGHVAHLPTRYLSAGQQRRLTLAALLLSPAAVWLLDEPFSALDAAARAEWQQHFRAFCNHGGAILMTGHEAPMASARTLDLTDA